MSHNFHVRSYPESVDKRSVQDSMDEYVRHEDWQEGASGTPVPIRWVDHVYDTRQDAEDAIEWAGRGVSYNCMAVKYKHYPDRVKCKAVDDLERRVRDQMQSLEKIKAEASIQNRTSDFIGCPKCGSSLKRVLIHGEFCPLCRADLRSKTNLARIENAKRKMSELNCKRDAAIREHTKPEIRWLVQVEYHT